MVELHKAEAIFIMLPTRFWVLYAVAVYSATILSCCWEINFHGWLDYFKIGLTQFTQQSWRLNYIELGKMLFLNFSGLQDFGLKNKLWLQDSFLVKKLLEHNNLFLRLCCFRIIFVGKRRLVKVYVPINVSL